MNCMYCGAVAGHGKTCPRCGKDLSVQKKSVMLSNLYYNRGLDKAQIRDLSGAIDLLQRSLKYNKLNLTARNLLGLIYFETGEIVSALSEWVISKNIKPEDNIASYYIEKVHAQPDRFETIHQTIKRYNMALEACRDGNEDVAEIMLKKVIAANPRLIKAFHLLGLIYIRNKEWGKARKLLTKAATIDRTNSTTLRFLKEIDEQTSIVSQSDTAASSGFGGSRTSAIGKLFGKKEKSLLSSSSTLPEDFWENDEQDEEVRTTQPLIFNMLPAFTGVLYIILGLVLGVLVVWFIAIPATRQQVSREADSKIALYSEEMAGQTRTIESLEEEIAQDEALISEANARADESDKKAAASEALMVSYYRSAAGEIEEAVKNLDTVDENYLSDFGKYMKQSLSTSLNAAAFAFYLNNGKTAFDSADYATAIDQLTKAKAINPGDYDTLMYLAHSYRLSHDLIKAREAFADLLALFPGDASAIHYYQLLENNDFGDGTTTTTTAAQAADAAAQAQAAQADAAAQAVAAAQTDAAAQADAAAQQPAQ